MNKIATLLCDFQNEFEKLDKNNELKKYVNGLLETKSSCYYIGVDISKYDGDKHCVATMKADHDGLTIEEIKYFEREKL